MREKKMINKCCVCGRERDEAFKTWSFRFAAPDPEITYSHGFCNICYETEIMKLKLRAMEPAMYS